MHVLVSGSSGLIGSSLVPHLRAERHRVTRLVRRSPSGDDERAWNPDAGTLDPAVFDGVDAVVHLGGVSIAGLWTKRRKAEIRNSRVRTTRLLAERMAALPRPPSVFVHASAVGYYGERGDEVLTEASPPGTGFLALLCRDWEAASVPAQDAGIRVVRLRTGVVLSGDGGALWIMLPAFQLGVAGPLGDGRQWMPWISMMDIVPIYARAIRDGSLQGAVNAVAPQAIRNLEFTKTLGRVLRRPTVLSIPKFLLKLIPGGMADETILRSERVVPEALMRVGHTFQHPELEGALRAALGR